MAAPYVMNAFLGNATTLNVIMSEQLDVGTSSNPDQYTIQNITGSGIIYVAAVYISENLQNIVTLITDEAHQEAGYLLTISGVLNLDKEEIDYNNNTAQYFYEVPDVALSLVTPAGGELYLNGQLVTIAWNTTTTLPLNIFECDYVYAEDAIEMFKYEQELSVVDNITVTSTIVNYETE